MLRRGRGPDELTLLTVEGRNSGTRHTTPVAPVEHKGHLYLVSAFGLVPWVMNARASGVVTLERGTTRQDYDVTELEPAAALPVLRAYLNMPTARYVRKLFEASATSTDDVFAHDAQHHPVFEATPRLDIA
jgi:deazaflavin-dependent oxidoreductase (nitroreductase family)